MSAICNKEKLILDFIVTLCGMYCLNENEAERYLKSYSPISISRRTYYNYKKKLYENCNKYLHFSNCKCNQTNRSQDCELITDFKYIKSKTLLTNLLKMERNTLIQIGLKSNINLEEYDKINYLPQYFYKLERKLDIRLDHSKKLIRESKSSQALANTNLKDTNTPPNATIKAEFIKCGKDYCNKCKHGPYYYAYWKVGNKLKKKYLGRYF